jgi:multicomponent K+:H+ antiporter subunit E/multicomponent Na+:H+ antiporter subunit E
MRILGLTLLLLYRFIWAVIISGLQTLWIILTQRHAANAAFVRLSFEPMSETGAALLGAMITLTPGTTTVDIDMEKREMLVHILDARDLAGIAESIRTQFEIPLVKLFGETKTND